MRRTSPPVRADDRHWRGSARFAAVCALVFAVLVLLVDWDSGSLTVPRSVFWTGLSAAVFVVLVPQRVSAGPGWLAVRGPLRRQTVRTDALTSVRHYGEISTHLVLRDAYGHRLELDARVLTANPLIWHELDTGVHRSVERGTLHQGTAVLERLGRQIDDEIAQAVLNASGLS